MAGWSQATWGAPVNAHAGFIDAFAAKLDSSGNSLWNTFMGSGAIDLCESVAVDTSGNVVMAGRSDATWGTPVSAYTGGADAFVARLNSSGTRLWHTFMGSASGDFAEGVAVDTGGNVFVAGWSDATWGTPVNVFAGGIDAFAAKIGSAGITSVTSASADGIYGIGAGIDVTVNFTEPATLSGGNLTVNLDTGGAATISPFGPAASASGTYTVTIGESSPDLDSSSPLVLAGGATLRDAGNSDVTLTIPAGQSLADGKAIVVIGPLVLGEIPTLSEWGMALFVGLILMASFGLIKRRNARGA